VNGLPVMFVALAMLGLIGHALLWIEFVNHVHATRMPRWAVWWLTLLGFGFLTFVPLAFLALWLDGFLDEGAFTYAALHPAMRFYGAMCVALSLFLGPLAVSHRRRKRLPQVAHLPSRKFDYRDSLGLRIAGGGLAQLMNQAPGNDALRLEVTRKRLELANLPPELDGLTICHLTDLHFTGRIPLEFFKEVIDEANALEPDLMLLTGDIVDKAHCLDWLPKTLGKLRARHGCYYILGNHDKRVPVEPLREILADCGLTSVSGRSLLIEIRGGTLQLSGNELPWLLPAANMSQAPLRPGDRPHLRLLLSHSPDQYAWARTYGFDLMLAGHNHGGQIVFPLLGPMAVPSRYGVKYACGVFYEAPTLLHVSRGISSELPLRLRCSPELALLELRRGAIATTAAPRDR
jgi:uncharacterized protein